MTSEIRTGVVLVVEDDQSLAELYSRFLEPKFSVRIALDGAAGLEMMDEDVDVVLLDRRMPGLSGSDVLEELRRKFDESQVAMVTAVDPDFDVLDMEFDEYITKPISKDELTELVEQLLIRASYDDQIRRFLSMASKRAALELRKDPAELEAIPEYVSLKHEMDELGSQMADDFSDLDESGFDGLFRDLG